MLTTEQATNIRQRHDAVRAFLGDRRSYRPEEVAHLNPPTNDETSALEVFELHRDQPEKFTAYVPGDKNTAHCTTWTGERVAIVCDYGDWHRSSAMGARWRQVRIKPDFCRWYYTGREYDFAMGTHWTVTAIAADCTATLSHPAQGTDCYKRGTANERASTPEGCGFQIESSGCETTK